VNDETLNRGATGETFNHCPIMIRCVFQQSVAVTSLFSIRSVLLHPVMALTYLSHEIHGLEACLKINSFVSFLKLLPSSSLTLTGAINFKQEKKLVVNHSSNPILSISPTNHNQHNQNVVRTRPILNRPVLPGPSQRRRPIRHWLHHRQRSRQGTLCPINPPSPNRITSTPAHSYPFPNSTTLLTPLLQAQAADRKETAAAESDLSHATARAGPFTVNPSGVAKDNPDRTSGSWNQTVGSAKESVGGLIGNESLRSAGERQNAEGKEQEARGQLSDLGVGVLGRAKGTVGSAVAGVLGDEKAKAEFEKGHDEGKARQRGVEAELQKKANA
jgi:uncharacterized protein YjbJ (UPF0337 family)